MRIRTFCISSLLTVLALLLTASSSDESLWNNARETGMDPVVLARLEQVVGQGIKAHAFPGCQVVVMKDGRVVYDRAFGRLTYGNGPKVTEQTLYDLASLSKTTGTLLAVMRLFDEEKLNITDSLAQHLPFLQGTNKGGLTIAQLLVHESGLPASLNAYRPDVSQEAFHDSAMLKIARMRMLPKTYRYSCVNFILLKEVVEAVSGQPMEHFLDSVFYRPMGLERTTYLPLRTHDKREIAPTMERDFLRNEELRGLVQDPDAALFGGVSGNAGLFSTAEEVARIHQMMLNEGELDGIRYMSPLTCRLFTKLTSPNNRRGLGFDKPVPSAGKNNPCCAEAPASVYGHTGYTGTCCWVDPDNKLVYVFLSNRTWPDDKRNRLARLSIRPKIQAIIYDSLLK